MEITPLEFNLGTSYSFENGQTTQHNSLLFGFLRVICTDKILKNLQLLTISSNNIEMLISESQLFFIIQPLSFRSRFHFFMHWMLLTLLISHPTFIANNGTPKIFTFYHNLNLFKLLCMLTEISITLIESSYLYIVFFNYYHLSINNVN